ncbi:MULTISPECIES: hypothetical protein, partial [unclassified Caballeronia]|uniref:hypothetical protein n=1 Tax=unclassified Caballeronia TaxID=2646786 RepID=UPI002028C315
YERRWTIESWHRILKSGCRVEARQFVNIPRQNEREFHGKANTNSTAKRTPIPRQNEQGFHGKANSKALSQRRGSTVASSAFFVGVPIGKYQVDHAQDSGSIAAAFRVRPQPS